MKSLGRKIKNNLKNRFKKVYTSKDIKKLKDEVLSKNFSENKK